MYLPNLCLEVVMGEDNKKLFRKSFRGFKKNDVFSYIEKLNEQFSSELEAEKATAEKEREKNSELQNELSSAKNELSISSAELKTIKMDLFNASREKYDLETEVAEVKEKLAAISAETEEAKAELASLRTRLAEAESDSVLKDNRIKELESIEPAPDPVDAYEESAKIIKSAKIDAAVIISKAEREAGFISVRSVKQRQAIAQIIEEELAEIINEYIDDYSSRTNDIFSELSVEYKKLYIKNAETHEQLVRSRASLTENAKERILKTIETISFDDEEENR